jgi:hypothetical protein
MTKPLLLFGSFLLLFFFFGQLNPIPISTVAKNNKRKILTTLVCRGNANTNTIDVIITGMGISPRVLV